jgi:NTE family protein
MSPASPNNIGLVLTGGGARAAYQAGVLRGISELCPPGPGPLRTITGISAGSINAAFLASRARDFRQAAHAACGLWETLHMEAILKTDVVSLSRLGIGWIRDLSMGGAFRGTRSTFLLDTAPLRDLLKKEIDFAEIRANIKSGVLHGMAVSATHYKTGTAITFFEADHGVEPWVRSSRIGKEAPIELDHILASAAIPVLFQPVRLEESYYGDGSIRLRAPLSPAIHLGSDKILAIGIRYYRPEDMTLELNESAKMEHITVSDIAGVMLNAAFMDTLESDVERLERINTTISLLTAEGRAKHPHKLRIIPLLSIRPSKDLGAFAKGQFQRFPTMLKHLLRGIGASEERGWDLLSYLSFDGAYTRPVMELGYSDALARKSEIIDFLEV